MPAMIPLGLPGAGPRWSRPHYLALLGLPVLFVEVWTVTAWLLDGPYVVRQFRDGRSVNWYAAHVLEILAVAVAVPIAIYVIRDCLRRRRLTFDAMFCLAGFSMNWGNELCNFFQPTFLESSNFVNLNSLMGHLPFVVNPDAGRPADMLLFSGAINTFGLLGLAMVAQRPLQWAKNRWPGISNARLLGLVCLAGLAIDLPLEFGAISLGLWTYTSPPWLSIPLGDGFRYALPELLAGGFFFALPIALRNFKDDSGRTFVERGLQHLTPRRQKAVALGALYFAFQFIVFLANAPLMLYGPYEEQWPRLPTYVVNDVCDAPGVHGTRYGLCPGSPGYHMPVGHSLPGRSP